MEKSTLTKMCLGKKIMYDIKYSKQAMKYIKKQDKYTRKRIEKAWKLTVVITIDNRKKP
jgi:hypothetical protein